jgi:hypothetical protein
MSSELPSHLATTREIRAIGPAADVESMRAAYLDLMKLSLCDLAGSGTRSVVWNGEDPVHTRELDGEALERRAVGADWPLNGLTMIGLVRLDDLQSCVESVVRDGVDGDLIEAGAWRGGATILMRAALDSLGVDDRTVWVADSFQGFPESDQDGFPEDPKLDPLSRIDFLAARLEDVRAHFARFGLERGVEFVPGFFEDTLPRLQARRWALARLDGDTYESTWQALEALYPGLSRGGYLVVDDYGFIDACRRAVDDFRREHGIDEPLEKVDWNGVRWRRESEPTAEPVVKDPGSTNGTGSERAVGPRSRARIPTWRELELTRELAAARERIEAVESEIARLGGSPLAGPRTWAGRRLRGRA